MPLETPGKSFDPVRLRRLSELEQWHFWFVGRRTLVNHYLGSCLKEGSQLILDLGCGTGFLLNTINARHRVLGLDLRPEGLLSTRRANPCMWLLQGEAGRLPLKDGVLDGALLLDVLEHVDDVAVLNELARVLKHKGWLILSVPALSWLWSYRDQAAGHLRRYNRNNLQMTLDSVKFRIERIRYYQFFLFPLVFLSRLLGRKGPLTRDLEESRIPFVNRIMTWINVWEARLSILISLPWGTSLVAVCRKP